jgi:hypothetical protein
MTPLKNEGFILRNYKQLQLVLLILLSLSLLTSCSSDPYANAGKCEEPGTYSKIEEKLAICSGLEDKPKFYFEGPAFEAVILLGKANYDILDFDNEIPFTDAARSRGFENLTFRTKWDITNTEIARYANGDERWDGLIEANSILISLKSEFESLQDYRFQKLEEYRAGKVSRESAYEAQQDALKAADRLNKQQEIFSSKLSILREEIKLRYGISNYIEPMLAVVVLQHNL